MNHIQNIDAQTLNKWLHAKEAVLIDVREVSEFNIEKIEGAKNIPLAVICLGGVVSSEYKNKKIVMQCRSGLRSMTAAQKIAESDNSLEIWNLEGGILAWKAQGFKTISN